MIYTGLPHILSLYLHCMCVCATYGQHACDLRTRTDLDTFIVQLFRIPRFRVVLLFVMNIDILNTSRRAPKPSQD